MGDPYYVIVGPDGWAELSGPAADALVADDLDPSIKALVGEGYTVKLKRRRSPSWLLDLRRAYRYVALHRVANG